jgi:membrane-associated protease RseP (regulator of RpoE activity)
MIEARGHEGKNLTLSYIVPYNETGPAESASLVSHHVRSLLGLAVLFVASSASAKSSNPAFLGVGMRDTGAPGTGPCMIDSITKDSGAQAAGLRTGDVFLSIDGAPVANCQALITLIQAHEPGDNVKIDVRRVAVSTTITAKLLSRADVLRQRFVGQPLPVTQLTRVDNDTTGELSSRGKTTIVGWYDQKNCVGCETVFGKVAQWSRGKSTKTSGISVLGATAGDLHKSVPENVEGLKQYQRSLDVPLLVTDPETFNNFAITDGDRIHFMVIDCRGVVQYAAPLAPDAEDKSAVLDELYAAAEQAAHRLK